MYNEWQYLTVDEISAPVENAIAIGPFGSRMKSDQYVVSGVPVIRGNNISDTRVFTGDFVYVSPETADELKNCNVHANDLVFPHRGAIGQVGIVPDDIERYMLSTSLMKLTCNEDLVDPLFLFYFFRSDVGQHEILKNASTVGTPGIGQPLTSLRSIVIPVPSLNEQHIIAHILGTLDDKIELNRQMNTTLEAIACAIFKSWFVDFDPVHAKANGEQPYGMDTEIAALFPDAFEESKLGLIPAGWQVTTLGDVLTVIETGTRPKGGVGDIEDGIPSIGASQIEGLGLFDTSNTSYISYEFFESLNRGIIEDRDVLLYKDGGRPGIFIPHVSIFGDGWPYETMTINSHVYRLRADGISSQEYLYLWMSSAFMMQEMHMQGGGIVPTINRTTLKGLPILIPSVEVLQAFDSVVQPLIAKVFATCSESQTLAELRDTLLPRLISGEIRVGEVEQ